jgi:peptide subunit release factor 1 (eRF1)
MQTCDSTAGRVLSVYLDVDQSKAANLNRGFDRAFEAKIQDIERTFGAEYERRDFGACLAEVRKLLSTYEPHGRGLIVFAKSAGPIWFRELNVPVSTDVRWTEGAYVQPFVEALDEFETYAVVLADRARARIFTVKLGTMEKHAEIYALAGVRHLKTAGTDHLCSQSHNQRKADEHSLSHLKRVVALVENTARFNPFDRLVLAGTTEVTSELFRLLPKSLRRKVIASAVIASNAPAREILEETLTIERRAQRAEEMKKAEALLTAAAKGEKAVTTLSETLDALNENRVRELVYSEGFTTGGGGCDGCHTVFPREEIYCESCSLLVKPVHALIEFAVAGALAQGSSIEQFRGDAAEKLRSVGGIGAFLRF